MSEDALSGPSRRDFVRGAVRPIQCWKAGWELIKNDYWLFLGISLVGTLIAGAVPLAILLGPMMCGIYICLLRLRRGRRIKFEMLFRGFDHFLPSLIATLIMIVPIIIVVIPAYVIFFVVVMSGAPKQGGPPNADFGWTVIAGMGIFYAILFLLSLVVSVLFFFIYPLIVDRGLSGPQAVMTSMRAAMGNFGGVLGIVLLNMLFGLIGLLACCVGAWLVMPVHYAAVIEAYRQAFPDLEELNEMRDEPGRIEGEDLEGEDPST
jgi:hypothetical protein